jgi:hypothetical protein
MVTHVKTTIEISDALLFSAKKVAKRNHTTIRALVEEGLRRVLEERRTTPAYRLPNASFRGNGLQPGIEEGGWQAIRDLIYGGRGT